VAFFNTPFGVVKNTSDRCSTVSERNDRSKYQVIDKGNTVRFERSTPFGKSGYERTKSELNDEERRLYEASKAKPE